MRFNAKSIVALLLAMVFVLSCFAGCAVEIEDETEAGTKADATTAETSGNGSETGDKETNGNGETTGGDSETETEAKKDEIASMKEELGNPDWGKKDFVCLVQDEFKSEVYAEDGSVDSTGGSAQVLNDAVLNRNKLLEENCNLTFDTIIKATGDMSTAIKNEATTGTGDFHIIDYKMGNGTTSEALSGTLHDWESMGIDVDKSWWDSGTADFALRGKVYFMTGDVNFCDDNFTYVLIFNKDMQKKYENTIPNPYQTVLDWEWTLDYFNSIIQGISSESSGDGVWDENDTYGFVTTYEFGNTLFIGSDLRYIKNDRTMDTPELAMDSGLEKALDVLDKSKTIFWKNNATFMSPPGEEGKGLSCFKEGRALFYSEIASYLTKLSSEMDTDYGILPIPKYDKAQQYYRTWSYSGASCLSITSAIKEADEVTVGKIVQWYAMLSSENVKPAFYDVMLTSRNVRDEESRQMLDIIFQNRVYDMAFYFVSEFNLYEAFRNAVYKNDDSFSRTYSSNTKRFDRKVKQLFATLDAKNKS